MSSATTITVIIPTLNEEGVLQSTLESCCGPGVERIVVDGGSTDRTAEIVSSSGAAFYREHGGRARQLNVGAEHANGELLLFLHADTTLPVDFQSHVVSTLRRSGTAAGAFRLRIAGSGWSLRVIEQVANLRSRFLQLPYGDQALFMSAERFRREGGFQPIPIMEDFDLVRRLRRAGRIRIAPASVQTSARRWLRRGPWRTTLTNQLMILRFLAGADLDELAAYYRRQPAGPSGMPADPRVADESHGPHGP